MQALNPEHLYPHSSDLLIEFVENYNEEQQQYEQAELIHGLYRKNTQDELARLKSKLEAEKRLTASQSDQLTEQSSDLKKAAKAIDDAQKLAHLTTAQQRENITLKEQLKAAQQSIRELNQLNPKKLKEQNKRQKEANEKAQARTGKLELEAKEYKKEIAALKNSVNQSRNLLIEQKRIIEHNTGAGLYHRGKDHLIIWPQKTKMQRPDGSTFEGRSLLYLEQSGRGGLITYDPETGAQLCAAPKGGLRPSSDTIDFAENWLFKVNEQQNGDVTDHDMIPVNHNPDLQPAK